MIVHDLPSVAGPKHHERRRSAGDHRIPPGEDVPCDHVRDSGRERIDLDALEGERVVAGAGSEAWRVARADLGGAAYQPAAGDIGRAIAGEIVAHEGVEVAARPRRRGAIHHRLDLAARLRVAMRRYGRVPARAGDRCDHDGRTNEVVQTHRAFHVIDTRDDNAHRVALHRGIRVAVDSAFTTGCTAEAWTLRGGHAMTDLARFLGDRKLVLLSNREPYEHLRKEGAIEVRRPPGGLVSALDPTMQNTHGVWVAWGSGSADRDVVDEHDRVGVPPEKPTYTLRRVWLSDDEVAGYYEGFANSALWPLCHLLTQHFEPRTESWESYRTVNDRFARAVAEEVEDGTNATVWVQDYHFALVPAALRALVPGIFVHQFWHIPFPPRDVFRLMPLGMATSLVRGLLGNDLLEFQTDRYARNFLDCVEELIPDAEVNADRVRVRIGDREVAVGAFPISIDVGEYERLARRPEAELLASRLRERYAADGRQLAVSVDRVDYTKGIPERLRGLERLWEQNPGMREKVTFLFVATPSRTGIRAYQDLDETVKEGVRAINARFRTPGWTPVVLIAENVGADRLAGLYRAADLCIVSSLQDGMNLVAKEFIACQVEERGVLLLSRFTGAADEIEGAILVNPFNVDGLAQGICAALTMPLDERETRMHRMRTSLRRATIFDWVQQIFGAAAAIQPDQRRARARARPLPPDPATLGYALDGRPLVLLLDIDGTLAPIAARPEGARVPEVTRRALQSLIASPDVHVALVTGRAATDGRALVAVEGAWTLGNHGLETIAPDGTVLTDPRSEVWLDRIGAAARDLQTLAARTPGAIFENKRLTLSLHYRLVEPELALTLIPEAERIASKHGLRTTHGRLVVETRPPIAVDKGTAVVALAERLGARDRRASVLFAGDDVTDEDAHRALQEMGGAVTIHVRGGHLRETAADWVAGSPEELGEWLGALSRWVKAGRDATAEDRRGSRPRMRPPA